jgi:S1-C subfamily serine protease
LCSKITIGALIVPLLFAFAPLSSLASETTIDEATVNLYCKLKLGGVTASVTGSGVFIDARGVILTNAHVAQYFLLQEEGSSTKTNCSVRVGTPAKDAYTASVLFISPQWARAYASAVDTKNSGKGTGEFDFALLYVDGAKKKKKGLPDAFPYLSLTDVITEELAYEGAPAKVAGYPAQNLDYKEIQKKLKRVVVDSSIEGFRTFMNPFIDVLLIAPSKAGRSGVSGGPITTEDDAVLGIASTMGNEKGENRSLRGITTTYIERTIQMDTGLSLSSILSGDYSVRTFLTLLLLPSDTIKNIETEIRRIK